MVFIICKPFYKLFSAKLWNNFHSCTDFTKTENVKCRNIDEWLYKLIITDDV